MTSSSRSPRNRSACASGCSTPTTASAPAARRPPPLLRSSPRSPWPTSVTGQLECRPSTLLGHSAWREIRNVSSLSLLGVVFFMLVMIGAFAVRSAAGFGAVLIAMPMLAFVLPVSTAVSITTALTAIASVHHLSRDWHRIAWRHFTILALYSAIGIVLGFYLINLLDERALRQS